MNAIKVANTKEMSHKEWLESRQAGIGGSDVGAIMGFNKYKTALDIYLDKTQPVKEEEQSESAYWGTVLEDIVAKEFEKRSGLKVRRNNAILQHPEHKFMFANIDREVIGEDAILECKTADKYLTEEWKEDEIPASYICQVQHYLAVTGKKKAYIAVLIGGNKFDYKPIERDEELINIIINEEKVFWNDNVLKNNPPITYGVNKDALNRLYNQDNGEIVDLDDNCDETIAMLCDVKAKIKELEKLQEEYENKIKVKLGENTQGNSVGYRVTWKTQTSNRVDTKKLKENYPDVYKNCINQTTSRVFRVKEIL